MDLYASVFGGFLYIDCSKEPKIVEKFSPENEMLLVIEDTNQPKDTPGILEWLGNRYKKNEATFMTGLSNIVGIVREAKSDLSKIFPNPKN